MIWNFAHQSSDKAILVDCHGGPFDGGYYSASTVTSIVVDDDSCGAIANAVFAGTQGRKGATFQLPFLRELTREIVTVNGMASINLHTYRVTEVEDSSDAIYMIAEFIR